jgi:hypothetical protein
LLTITKLIVKEIPKVFYSSKTNQIRFSFLLAVRIQTTTCPGYQLQVLVTLNGIDPNYVLLGDSSCKPQWSNETHAQFVTHIDNCSMVFY